ncbi:MAG TPA: alkaline phosphatase family protein [Candidatus Binataceae bacterium]
MRKFCASTWISLSFALAFVALTSVFSCAVLKLVSGGGEKQVRAEPHPEQERGPHVLIFAFDGVGSNQLMDAINSGGAPNMRTLLGKDLGDGVYQNAYWVPNAISILPSTTMAAWSAIFTGAGPAYNGVPGNEWFVREQMRFYAPAPVSITDTDDTLKMITEGLVGKSLKSPTLFQQVGLRSYVSLNPVYRGADIFTTVAPADFVSLMGTFIQARVDDSPSVQQSLYAKLDRDSVPKLLDAIDKDGFPSIQVVYFPGIDLYTHLAANPLRDETEYLEQVTDPLVEKIVDAYQEHGHLDHTYILIIADHGHTPVLKDGTHALGAKGDDTPAALLSLVGFRTRKFVLEPEDSSQDYQAALAYQGAMAYVYLADRSTCPDKGDKCRWDQPPRFEEDVMPVARAFYRENMTGRPFPIRKGDLDLIFARRPVPRGQNTLPYEIYDGRRLVPIAKYLVDHPRPDLLQLDRRMRWLSAGPYGNRAGDVLLLAKSGLNRPMGDRFYFSAPYKSWHGSPSVQDSHIPLIVARKNYSGSKFRILVERIAGEQPSQLDFVPIVRALLAQDEKLPERAEPARSQPSPLGAGR